jgi:glutaredoxin 2
MDHRSYSHQKKKADSVDKLLKHFKGKNERCTLPDYSKDTLAAYSAAAAGACDWAKQQLICGTFKTVFDIMDLPVDAKVLAMGCPDVGAIAN